MLLTGWRASLRSLTPAAVAASIMQLCQPVWAALFEPSSPSVVKLVAGMTAARMAVVILSLCLQVYGLSSSGAGGRSGMSYSGRVVVKQAAAKKPVITGFEGLQPIFHEDAVYPAYRPGAVQTMHSGGGLGRVTVAGACLFCP
jgi:hypothetical protein